MNLKNNQTLVFSIATTQSAVMYSMFKFHNLTIIYDLTILYKNKLLTHYSYAVSLANWPT